MSKLFKERIPFKPFEYPIYYTEGWLKQQLHFGYILKSHQGDVKDWNERVNIAEKNLVGNILLGFFKPNVQFLIIGLTWLLIGFLNMKSNRCL